MWASAVVAKPHASCSGGSKLLAGGLLVAGGQVLALRFLAVLLRYQGAKLVLVSAISEQHAHNSICG